MTPPKPRRSRGEGSYSYSNATKRQGGDMTETNTSLPGATPSPGGAYSSAWLPSDAAGRAVALICRLCGALVLDTNLHSSWHDNPSPRPDSAGPRGKA